ncbi:hypothetical protein Lepto7376_2037 [[Leptolyngbya] sp. PCC 7376]|uniref:hypothetical protein n=1 Tax=[Leptolyngbya] sp. PCC 7376 TaxID=111781 RepID=UPI00029F40D2|nr:hypothetical protein [[Leptolyngbya] sp. PCC 7376]AFY38339.1 hypothetical protein Lepto7376_2037 [[Leptolyngbya] sp. PCC 7376]
MSFENDHQQCLQKLIWAMEELHIDFEMTQLNKIANLIVQTMTGPWRSFHTPEHIFEVGGSDHPIELLAALFHDVVYVQVDKSVNFNLSYYIVPFVKEVREQLFIREVDELPDDPLFRIILDLFGFQPGQPLSSFGGQNEFLSAVVGAKVLEPFLSPAQLVEVICCIETTIPFRPDNEAGVSAAMALFHRLEVVNQKYDVHLSKAQMEDTIRRAVRLSNRDVGSFAHPKAARFLDGTWDLLPETNHNLHNRSSYTVVEYRQALQKMEGFMNFLRPNIIFQEFMGEPDKAIYDELVAQSEHNLQVGRLYLGCKLFTIGFLEAISRRLGRDIPLSSMMGELPSQGEDDIQSKLIDYIPAIDSAFPLRNEVEKEVLDLLEKGRYQSASYDLKNSPLATYIVKSIGFDAVREQCDRAKLFFRGELSQEEFLESINPEITLTVVKGINKLFEQRQASLMKIMPVVTA